MVAFTYSFNLTAGGGATVDAVLPPARLSAATAGFEIVVPAGEPRTRTVA